MDSNRGLRWARVGATVLVAVPALGIGVISLWQAAAEGGALSFNQLFHLGSGLALIVLYCDLAVAVLRSSRASHVLLLGAGGFALSLIAAIAVELFGPPVLLALVVLSAVWAAHIASSREAF